MELRPFILETVREAGERLKKLLREGFTTSSKGGDVRDIVTSADHEINKFLIDSIQARYPKHAIFSEEGGDITQQSDFAWTIDPIDGTSNFSRHIPHFAVSICILENGIPYAGAVYNPITDELFSFEKGKGVFLNGDAIRVSTVQILKDAHVLFHAGRKEELRDWGGESYRRLLGSVQKTKNLGSSALDICFLAAGRVEGYVTGTLTTRDIAAAIGILTEAGGVLSDREGNTVGLSDTPQTVFAANNREILNTLRTLLQS